MAIRSRLALSLVLLCVVFLHSAQGSLVLTAVFSGSGPTGTVTFTQTDLTSPTHVNLALTGLSSQAGEFYIAAFPDTVGNCSLAALGDVFNPLGASGLGCTSSSTTNCKAGQVSERQGIDLSALSSVDMNFTDYKIPLHGGNRINGRSFVIFHNLIPYCATIGPADTCASDEYMSENLTATTNTVCLPVSSCTVFEYETMPSTNFTDRVCTILTQCPPTTSYVSVGATATTDRQCATIAASQMCYMTFADATITEFEDIKTTFINGLDSIIGYTPSILGSYEIAAQNDSVRNDLVVTLVVFNTTVGPPISPLEYIPAILAVEANTSCVTAQDLACDCTQTNVSGSYVGVPLSCTFNILNTTTNISTESCFVSGGTTCLTAVDSFTTLGSYSGAAYKDCSRNFPHVDSCLERLLKFNVLHAVEVGYNLQSLEEIPPIPKNPNTALNSSFSDLAVKTMKDIVDTFRHLIQPQGFPVELVRYQIKYYRSHNGSLDSSTAQSDAISYFTPFVAVMALSFLIALFFPIIMCIIGCCRCCKCCCCWECCGGRKIHKHPSNTKRIVLMTILFALCILFLLVLYGFYQSDQATTSSITSLQNAAFLALDNLEKYKNSTINQVIFLGDDLLNQVSTTVFYYLDRFTADLSSGVTTLISQGTDTVLTSLENLANEVSNLTIVVDTIETDSSSLTSDITTLNNDLSTFSTENTNEQSSCNSIASGLTDPDKTTLQNICALYLTTLISVSSGTFGDIPSLSSQLTTLNDIQSINLTAQANLGREQFNTIPELIYNLTSDIRSMVSEQVNNYTIQIHDQIINQTDKINEQFYNQVNISDMKQKVIDYLDIFRGGSPKVKNSSYSKYRSTAVTIIVSIYGTLIATILLGLLCGACGNSGKAINPTYRNKKSDAGGNTLVIVIYFLVFLAIFVNIICGIFFLLTTLSGEMCEGFTSGKILSLIDDPATFDGKYVLGDLVLQNGSLDLTVSHVLDSCRRNDAIWDAMQLDERLNMSEYLDIRSKFNVSGQFSNLNLDTVDIVNFDATSSLQSVLDMNLTSLDFASFYEALNVNFTESFDPSLLVTTMDSILSQLLTFQQGNNPSGLSTLIADTNATKNTAQGIVDLISAMDATRADEIAAVAELETTISDLEAYIQIFLDDVDSFKIFFANTTAEVLDTDGLVNGVIDDLQLFVNNASGQVRHDLGRCQLLSDIYDTALHAYCGDVQTGLDSYFLALALIAFFTFPVIIFCFLVARHLRRMDECEDQPQFDDDEYYNDPEQQKKYNAVLGEMKNDPQYRSVASLRKERMDGQLRDSRNVYDDSSLQRRQNDRDIPGYHPSPNAPRKNPSKTSVAPVQHNHFPHDHDSDEEGHSHGSYSDDAPPSYHDDHDTIRYVNSEVYKAHNDIPTPNYQKPPSYDDDESDIALSALNHRPNGGYGQGYGQADFNGHNSIHEGHF